MTTFLKANDWIIADNDANATEREHDFIEATAEFVHKFRRLKERALCGRAPTLADYWLVSTEFANIAITPSMRVPVVVDIDGRLTTMTKSPCLQ